MPKKLIELNKTNKGRITKWLKQYNDTILLNKDIFEVNLRELCLDEVKCHRDCTEKSVVQFVLDAVDDYLTEYNCANWNDDFADIIIRKSREKLAQKYCDGHEFNNNIDIYFNDVKREYILHPMNESDSLEFLPENREIFIKNNLKLVVTCAKKYRGCGLPFEDLIQTGNYGLLVAFDKFDKNRANLKNAIIKNIDASELETFTHQDAVDIVTRSFTYDHDLERTINTLPEEGFGSVQDFYDWVKKNVKTAVFASVAFQWIRAYILLELNKRGKTIHITKPNKKKKPENDQDYFVYEPSIPDIVSLDSVNPNTNDNYHDGQISSVANEIFAVEEDSIDIYDNEDLFKDIINRAIATLSDLHRRIIKKRFGIGFPSPLNIGDIADSEGIAHNRVKYIITCCLKEIRNNISENDMELLADYFGHLD